eukprot:48527-Prorocentrum_minimum.AAC.1
MQGRVPWLRQELDTGPGNAMRDPWRSRRPRDGGRTTKQRERLRGSSGGLQGVFRGSRGGLERV